MTVSLLDTHQVDNYQVTCKQQMGTNSHRKAENAEQETLEVWTEPWEWPLKSGKGASHTSSPPDNWSVSGPEAPSEMSLGNMHSFPPTLELHMAWDFPGSPVVDNPPSSAGHVGLTPGQGPKIPHALGQLSPLATVKDPAPKK